jgi:hypothetical protein|nr:MAG TPA: hypothetical protein [Caudoviricetes sp.]
MKPFIKEFLINLVCGLIVCIVLLIWVGIGISILTYIPDGILQLVSLLSYFIISAALLMTIFSRADKEITDKIRGYK